MDVQWAKDWFLATNIWRLWRPPVEAGQGDDLHRRELSEGIPYFLSPFAFI